jgi:hypothetical protein
MKEQNWWRLNRRKDNDVYVIEWNSCGVIRAKSDSISEWQYRECPQAKYALHLGLAIIREQRREVETN